MAGNQNSGGLRPSAPQNNPANVSATGGNGQSGQPKRYISGLPYGQGQATMAQQAGAPMAKSQAAPSGMPSLGTLLDETNNPSEPITAGVDFGPGPGSDALPKNIDANTRPDENKMIVDKYMPVLLQAAKLSDAPDSFKRFVNYLLDK
jgi:hypothetical protein